MDVALLDLSYLARLYKGDRARMDQWIHTYLEEAPTYIGKLTAALENDSAHGLALAAHELRPLAHYLGLPRLLELLVAMEDRACTEGVPAARVLVEELLSLGQAVEVELRAKLVTA